ncbi:MAG: FeoB-associated Cys-rich membrane protein [Clostridia bacterium]|nr:FeoB-associated Cys-rich membrane protein [Clostridia bacterium]
MAEWLAQNYGSIIVFVILSGIVAAIIVGMVRGKKKGKRTCTCGCSNCPMSGKCHGTNS